MNNLIQAAVVIMITASTAQAQQPVSVIGWGAGLTNGGELDFPNYGQLLAPTDLGIVRQLVAGGYHNASLGIDGKVRCWGRNAEGQCDVPSSLDSVVSIAAGHTAIHALRTNGRIVSWGQNYSGELTPPADLNTVDLIGSGYWHVLAHQSNGIVRAWGNNQGGQCDVPSGLVDVVQLTGGRFYSLALSSQGVVTGWGSIVVPTDLGPVRKVAAGNYHAAAIRSDRTVQCWGLNDRGQCEAPAWLHDATDIGAGEYHTVALRMDGSAVCWGANTTVAGKPCGQALSPDDLHDGTAIAVGGYHSLALRRRTTAPTIAITGGQECGVASIPAGVSSAVRVTARDWHVGIIDPTGHAKLWGRLATNPDFGENDTTSLGMCNVLSAGGGHSAAVLTDGSVRSWGRNYAGECVVPGDLGAFPTVVAGYAHNLAIRADGLVRAWGWNDYGQANVPAVAGECRQVAAGYAHNVAVRRDWSVIAWGRNELGQTQVPAGCSTCTKVACGTYHSLALQTDGSVLGWGWNDNGQSTVPPMVARCIDIAAGGAFSIALQFDGTVFGWGSTPWGTTTGSPMLGQVGRCTAIAAGGHMQYAGAFVAALIETEDCNSDGIADYGQCHDGTLPDYNSNNIPDCCERGEACVASDYPMRWRVEDGGNGHWYKLLHVLPSESAEQHFIRAQEAGGYTATISSTEENRVCFGIANSAPIAVLIGIRKQAGNNIPEWITGEPWAYSNWHSGEGSNSSERYADYVPEWGGQWQDTDTTPQQYSIIEWSADCNNDGIVDKGQILQGQLADANGDGVPDVCQQPTCHDADLFVNGVINGADLGILLSQWGPAPIGTVSDINRDGQVNGADLGFLLNAWGPCSN